MSSDPCVGLTAAELAGIQATVEAIFDTPVTITRNVGATDDGYGHNTGGTPTQVAAVNAIFEHPGSPTLTEIAARIGVLMVWVVSLPLATDVQTLDVITITATGQQFTVHVVQEPESYAPYQSVIVGKVV